MSNLEKEDREDQRLLLSAFALNGLLSHSSFPIREDAAKISVEYADALLAELEKSK